MLYRLRKKLAREQKSNMDKLQSLPLAPGHDIECPGDQETVRDSGTETNNSSVIPGRCSPGVSGNCYKDSVSFDSLKEFENDDLKEWCTSCKTKNATLRWCVCKVWCFCSSICFDKYWLYDSYPHKNYCTGLKRTMNIYSF